MLTPDEIKTEVIRVAPPVGVSATTILGIPLNEWVYVATIIYIFIQCICILYKTFFKKKGVQE
jgi:hypothetical protein